MVKLKQFKMDKKPIQINMSTHSSADELETCCKLFQDTLIKFNEIKQAKKKDQELMNDIYTSKHLLN